MRFSRPACSEVRPVLVSHYDREGGAARATYRLHRAFVENGVESRLLVSVKRSDDWRVLGPERGPIHTWTRVRPMIGDMVMRLQRTSNPVLHSAGFLPSGVNRTLDRLDANLVHLNWVGEEMMSIGDIGRINKPTVWTLHDMWAFCGAEHYAPDGPEARFRSGYTAANRPPGHQGRDIDRWVWERKMRAWRPMHVITTTSWMADCARSSALMRDWPVHVIPLPLDLTLYRPLDKRMCRKILGLPEDVPLILFGALGGAIDPRKGFDLLVDAMKGLGGREATRNARCVVFGQSEPQTPPDVGLPIHWMGYLSDDQTLAMLYNAVDVMVVPSRQESFGQTASEAQACGTPVVAFAATGLTDVVENGRTGHLARPYDTNDLADGIESILADAERRAELSAEARARAVRLWSPDRIVARYCEVYSLAMKGL